MISLHEYDPIHDNLELLQGGFTKLFNGWNPWYWETTY